MVAVLSVSHELIRLQSELGDVGVAALKALLDDVDVAVLVHRGLLLARGLELDASLSTGESV